MHNRYAENAQDIEEERTGLISGQTKSGNIDWRKTGVKSVPNRRWPPPKTTAAALTFLILGTYFLLQGLYDYHIKMHAWDRTGGLVLLGTIMFIPGWYSSYVLFGAYHRWRGFDYSHVPSWDD